MNDSDVATVITQSKTLRREGKFEDAIKLLDQALNKTPDARLFYSRGITYDLMDNREKAIDDLTSAISLDPENPSYYFERGSILSYPIGDDNQAIQDFKRVIQLEPKHVGAHRQCCLSLLVMGKPNEALTHAIAALQLKPEEGETHFCLGEAYLSLDLNDEAVASLRKAVNLDSSKEYYTDALNRALKRVNSREKGSENPSE